VTCFAPSSFGPPGAQLPIGCSALEPCSTRTLFNLTAATFERAATLDPEELRSLDALHLAAALELGDELDGIVTYDHRMAAAASLYGVAVQSPA
jgi:predicted nucleic acid-binding protein